MKKLLRDRGLVERRGVPKLLHQFSLTMFSLLLKYFFLSGKYSHLIDLFFHVVYFLLENDIL